MSAPAKPATPRAKPARTWTVYEQREHANIEIVGSELVRVATDVTVLILVDASVVARTGSDACWKIAEGALKDRAQSSEPPLLCASRNGTAHGLTEARPYALKATVERVR